MTERFDWQGFNKGELVAGRYRVLRDVAAGAVGMVYLAKDEKVGDRVAVKTLKPLQMMSEVLVRRFEREGKALKKIQHPHIVRYRDHGFDELGRPFLVTDYVLGRDGSAIMNWSPPLTLDAFVRLIGQICRALDVVHDNGIVHRDLKWSNLMVRGSQARELHATLIDFGVLRWGHDTNPGTPLTKIGEILGTPTYCSPEQIAGRSVDARADIYALGAMCYEFLAGRPPFGGEAVRDILMAHVQRKPVPIRERVTARPDVPTVIEAAVMTCLEKDPDNRWPSAGTFMRALESAFPASMREWLRK